MLTAAAVSGFERSDILFHQSYHGDAPMAYEARQASLLNGGSLKLEEWGLAFGEGYQAPVIETETWQGDEGAIAFWVRPEDWDVGHEPAVILTKPYKAVGGGFLLYKYDKAKTLYFYAAQTLGGGESKSGVVLNYGGLASWKKGEWHHVALAWRRNRFACLYVDGKLELQREGEFQFPASCSGIMVSNGTGTGGWGCSGKTFMRDLYLFRRPLLDTEVALLARDHPRGKVEVPLAHERLPKVIPVAVASLPPLVDGRVGSEEYPCRLPGLIDTATHTLYPDEATVFTGSTREALHVAVRVAMPAGYTPSVLSTGDDDDAQIAKGDLVLLFLRADADLGLKTYEGIYVTVDPAGHRYDALEQISWEELYCHRHGDRDFGISSASRIEGGVWTVELSVPWTAIGVSPGIEAFALSAGVQLGTQRLSLVDHPNWFDHNEAFVRAQTAALGVRVILGDPQRGELAATLTLTNRGAAVLSGTLRSSLSVPTFEQTVTGVAFDMVLGKETKLDIGRTAASDTRDISLPPGGLVELTFPARIEAPDTYLLLQELRLAGKTVLCRSLPFTFYPPVSVSLSPVPSKNIVRAAVSLYGIKSLPGTSLQVSFRSETGAVMARAECPVAGREQILDVDAADLVVGTYRVECVLRDQEGHGLHETSVVFEKRPDPEWLANPKGRAALDPDWVPAPWTPIEHREDALSVWGRRFGYGRDGLIESLTSQGRDLLAAPIVVRYRKGEDVHTFSLTPPTFESVRAGEVRLTQTGTAPHASLSSAQRCEFDGLVWFDLTIPFRGQPAVDELWVEIPLSGMTFCYDYSSNNKTWHSGRIEDFDWQQAHHIWLGNDRVGLTWFAESYQGWQITSTKPRISLRREGTTHVLRLLLINEPIEVTAPVTARFGLHPTPVKPFFDGWRGIRPQGWAWTPPPTNLVMFGPTAWASSYCKPVPRNWKCLDDLVAFCRRHGQKAYPYTTPFTVSPYDMLKRETPFVEPPAGFSPDVWTNRKKEAARTEDYWAFAEDWNLSPTHAAPGGKQETSEHVSCTPSGSWTDYFVGSLHEVLSRSDVDGFYFDLASPRMNFDEERGCSYRTRDGRLEGTIELEAGRLLYKRLYAVFDELRGPARKPYILGHGFPSYTPLGSFWDVPFHGEEIKPKADLDCTRWALQSRLSGHPIPDAPDPKAQRSFDALAHRAHCGAQFGMPIMYLPQYGHSRDLYKPCNAREMLAWTFPHNNLLWPAYIPHGVVYEFWNKVEVPFGMADTEFHPYWDNGVRARPECVRVSYWKRRDGDRYLLAAANWSTEPVDAAVELPGAMKVFRSGTDPEKEDEVALADGTWRVTVPGCDLRVLVVGE